MIYDLTPERPFRLSAVYGHGAVLQRGVPHVFWGSAPDSALVQAEADFISAAAVSRDGQWILSLDPLPEGGPYTVSFSCLGETITLNRIHVGDVWLVAGQSNARKHAKLQLPDGCSGYSGFGPTNKGIYPDDVWQSLIDIRRQWVSHGQVSRFGAAFAIEMHEQLQIPIGIASIAFPGTPIQSWYSSAGHPKAVGSTAKWVRKLPPATMAKEWVRPLYRMPARGVVWWQGESNVPAHADYADHLQRMIAEWRSGRGDPDMPFIIVKLQSIATESAADLEAMRAAQEAAAKSAGNCILVESADLAASGDVHPPPEELASIGRRAAAMYIAATPSLGRNSP